MASVFWFDAICSCSVPSGGFYMQVGTSTAKRTSRAKLVWVYSVYNMFGLSGGIGHQLFPFKMNSEHPKRELCICSAFVFFQLYWFVLGLSAFLRLPWGVMIDLFVKVLEQNCCKNRCVAYDVPLKWKKKQQNLILRVLFALVCGSSREVGI